MRLFNYGVLAHAMVRCTICTVCVVIDYNKCKKLVYTRVNGALHIENCKNYKKVITHQHTHQHIA